MPLLSQGRDRDRDRRAALRAAPVLGTLDETSSQAPATMFREDIEIADFAEAAHST
jgi:hypothetical protein